MVCGQRPRLSKPLHVCAASAHYDDTDECTCSLCGVRAHSAAQLQRHLDGQRHAKAVRRAEAPEFAATAEESLNSLETMNEWLKRLGHDEAESRAAAKRVLRGIHINLYDLVEDRLAPVFDTVPELRKYSVKHGKIFPRDAAKEGHSELRQFLRRFSSSGR